jgi:hypothetical protein
MHATNLRRAARALTALAALLPLAASAAEPTFTTISPISIQKAKAQGKTPGRTVPAEVRNEMRATLGADGKVRLDCETVNRSSFPANNRHADPAAPAEAK